MLFTHGASKLILCISQMNECYFTSMFEKILKKFLPTKNQKAPHVHSIDYKIVSQFMNTKSKKVEVDRSLVENLQHEQQGEEINGDAIIDGNEEGEDVTVYVRCSNSVYSGIQSALSFPYRQSGFECLAKLKIGVSLYCKGGKRLGTVFKQKLAFKIAEGKKPMSKAVYSF
jgi:hypothetical protein